jgi:hypothetical protein
MTDVRPDASALRRFLLAGRNQDDGWGYYAGKGSRLEATCWALLALPELDPAVLTRWPAEDGLLRERSGGAVNYAFHALALIALMARRVEHVAGNATLAGQLERAKGIALPQNDSTRQDNQLQGWSWIDGTFSWVEPTAWAMLALKKHAAAGGRVDRGRLRVAEALLGDRCCEQGGWNYGNANMLGKALRPYVPTTAVALLALQGVAQPAVPRSLAFLDRASVSEPSALALSLAIVALGAHRHPAAAARARLAAESGKTIDLGNQVGAAMALYALQAETTDGAFIL